MKTENLLLTALALIGLAAFSKKRNKKEGIGAVENSNNDFVEFVNKSLKIPNFKERYFIPMNKSALARIKYVLRKEVATVSVHSDEIRKLKNKRLYKKSDPHNIPLTVESLYLIPMLVNGGRVEIGSDTKKHTFGVRFFYHVIGGVQISVFVDAELSYDTNDLELKTMWIKKDV